MVDRTADHLGGVVAIVSGAGSGLGRAFALGLVRAGAAVGLLGRTTARLKETAGRADGPGRTVPVAADVTDMVAVRGAVRTVERVLGPVSLLVNNAGLMSPVGPDWQVDPDSWWRTVEVNLRGAFHLAAAVLPGMVARGAGRIINVSSSAAHNLQPYTSAYGASKAALSYWTAALATAVGSSGVRVFAYAPGFVRTAMTEFLAHDKEARRWIGPGLGKALDEGRTTSMEHAVERLLDFASGRLDALHGRHVDARDDLARLTEHLEEITRRNLYALQRPTLDDE